MPEPIIEPITIIVASIGPSARTSPGPRGAGPPPGRSGPTVRPGARRLHRRGTSTPLEHQIIDRSAIRPHLTGLDEPGPEPRFAQRNAISQRNFHHIEGTDQNIPAARWAV